MSLSDLFSSGFKTRNRDHFATLASIALADGVVTPEESAFIHHTAQRLDIETPEIEAIISNPAAHPVNPPYSGKKRLERLYDLSRMVLVDHIADAAEKKMMKRFIIGLGFPTQEAETIMEKSFELLRKGIDEDKFIEAF
ncbi:TerB family tellurite resistance protein [Flavobacteriaceae bacterium]|nr:TerB family tellurite resistance protein [Flavobacteriaceae bacterium]